MQSLLKLPSVLQRTGESQSGLYAKISAGLFPRPVKLGKRSVAWVSGEVDAWIEAKIAARDAAPVGKPEPAGEDQTRPRKRGRPRKNPVAVSARAA